MMHQQKNTSTAVNNSEKDEKRLTLSSLVRVCGRIFETRRARTASSADATENTAPILAWLCRPLSVNAWLWNQLWKDCSAQLNLMRSNPGLTSSSLIWDEEGNSQANLGMVLRPISKNVNNVTDCNVSCNVSNNLSSQRVAKYLSVHAVHAVHAVQSMSRWGHDSTQGWHRKKVHHRQTCGHHRPSQAGCFSAGSQAQDTKIYKAHSAYGQEETQSMCHHGKEDDAKGLPQLRPGRKIAKRDTVTTKSDSTAFLCGQQWSRFMGRRKNECEILLISENMIGTYMWLKHIKTIYNLDQLGLLTSFVFQGEQIVKGIWHAAPEHTGALWALDDEGYGGGTG